MTLAVGLEDAYDHGILPNVGGLMDQDWFYMSLITMASNAKDRQGKQYQDEAKRKAKRGH